MAIERLKLPTNSKLKNMYKSILRPILFAFKPEKAHKIIFSFLKIANRLPLCKSFFKMIYAPKDLSVNLFGLNFPNPLGLAAGLDKEAEAFDMFGAMGFGFVEIGTLTPKAQAGNPKPRLFRLVNDKALINRMGFNNSGVEAAVKRLRKKKTSVIIGGNIGKNKVTPNDIAYKDYLLCFNALYDMVDYFAVNLSSPNTPNLRELQEKKALEKILSELIKANKAKPKPKPILLKIAPDLTNGQLDDIIETVTKLKIDGIIATNTTIKRENISIGEKEIETLGAGGLSGKPLTERSTEIIKYLSKNTNGQIPIIASGGVMTPQDAATKLKAGASLVQVYTGFIYEGPGLIKKIVNFLR